MDRCARDAQVLTETGDDAQVLTETGDDARAPTHAIQQYKSEHPEPAGT